MKKIKNKTNKISCFIGFSYTIQRPRVYHLVRTPVNIGGQSYVLKLQNDKDRPAEIVNQQLSSIGEEDRIQTRESWDSGEDSYFEWAPQNRRPIEYLTGRKRALGQKIRSTQRQHVHDGLWRSGLVG